MTTALTVPQPSAPVDWDRELRGATYLLKSGLCPVALKTPEAILFVVLAGRDLGLSPVAALRGLTIIQGKIEVSADLSLGLFHRAGGKSQWRELTDTNAAIVLSAPWLTAPHTSTFSMEDAKRAGLSNDNYKRYPKAMLRSRAITQGLKDIGFDATAGCYAPGEITGIVEPAPEPVRTIVEDALGNGIVQESPPPLQVTGGQWLTGAEMKALKRDVMTYGIETPEAWKSLLVDTVPDWTPARGLTASEAATIRKRLEQGDAFEVEGATEETAA